MWFRAAWIVALTAALAALVAATDHHGVHSAKALRERFGQSVEPFLIELALQLNAALRIGRIAVTEHGARDYLPDLAVVVAEAHRRRPLHVDLAYLGTLDECDDCKAEVLPLQERFKSDASREFFNNLAKDICNRFELFSPHVCNGTVDIFTDAGDGEQTVIEVIAHSRMEPLEVCGDAGVCDVPDAPTWNVTFPREKPPVRTPPTPQPDAPRKYLLHLTDVHYDPLYTVGLEADCEDPMCCRPPNPLGTRRPAGQFGDFRCDAPRNLLVNMLQFAAQSGQVPTIDYILWTGDIPPHDVWESSRTSYTDLMNDQAQLLADFFPGVPTLGAIGNHEGVPVDQFPPRSVTEEEYSSGWLYETLADQWSRWLPESALEQLRFSGSFSVLLEPGLRAISVNDEGCSSNNFWMRMKKETGCCKKEYADPDNALHWLVEELQAAEDADERVLMLRHVPNSSRCNRAWSLNYHQIMTRYENTIIAMFTGHTHRDEFELFYRDDEGERAAVINYVGPAATPYSDANPGFRVYESRPSRQLDADTLDIVNTYTYVANLTAANQNGYLDWYLEYTAADAYGMTRLAAQDWHDVALRFLNDTGMFNEYYFYKSKSVDPDRTCTGACVTSEVCSLRTSYVGQPCPPVPSA